MKTIFEIKTLIYDNTITVIVYNESEVFERIDFPKTKDVKDRIFKYIDSLSLFTKIY